jgi:predicted nucleic acid-binding protein
LPMDFADASLVVACERHDVTHVFTLDRKHFSIYRPKHTRSFQLLPGSNEG